MCDYSLYHFPNRLCMDHEELVAYRFSSGCIGLVSITDAQPERPTVETWFQRNWPGLRSWFLPRQKQPGPTAVCIPPGTRLTVESDQNATFIHTNVDAFRYRDGLRLEDGKELLLQNLAPGTKIQINTSLDSPAVLADLREEAIYESA